MDKTKDERKKEGDRIERLVADELARRGYSIVSRNYTKKFGEIDIVALRGRELVVCEVRSRTSGCVEDAADTVGPAKRRKIRMTTEAYLRECPYRYDEVRFFVAAVIAPGGRVKHLELFEDAF